MQHHSKATILLIDRGSANISTLRRLLSDEKGYQLEVAESEGMVIDALRRMRPTVILLHPSAEGLDGASVVSAIHERDASIPIILITTKGQESAAIRAFAAGAVNYIPRHLLRNELFPTLRSVLQAAQRKEREQQLMQRMTDFYCRFELENNPALLPSIVHYLQDHLSRLQLCGDSMLIRAGIAIDEALVNAMHHGNLELDSSLRETDNETYDREVRRRAHDPPYAERRIQVEARISKERAEISVRDDGKGFDPTRLPNPTDLEHMDKVAGRGVHLMRSFMDEVRFNERGNCVTLVLKSRRCPNTESAND